MKRMNVMFFANGNRIEVIREPSGGIEIYRHGMMNTGYAGKPFRGMNNRCVDSDESLFRLGPEETRELLKFLAE